MEGPIQMVTLEEIVATKDIKLTKASGFSEVNMEIIASGMIGTTVVLELCQYIVHENGMLDE